MGGFIIANLSLDLCYTEDNIIEAMEDALTAAIFDKMTLWLRRNPTGVACRSSRHPFSREYVTGTYTVRELIEKNGSIDKTVELFMVYPKTLAEAERKSIERSPIAERKSIERFFDGMETEESGAAVPSLNFEVGELVSAKYSGDDKWYPVTILKKNDGGEYKYDVKYSGRRCGMSELACRQTSTNDVRKSDFEQVRKRDYILRILGLDKDTVKIKLKRMEANYLMRERIDNLLGKMQPSLASWWSKATGSKLTEEKIDYQSLPGHIINKIVADMNLIVENIMGPDNNIDFSKEDVIAKLRERQSTMTR